MVACAVRYSYTFAQLSWRWVRRNPSVLKNEAIFTMILIRITKAYWIVANATNVAECSLDSFLLTGMVEQSILEQLGFQVGEATLDEKAEVLFLGQLYGSKFLSFCINYIYQSLPFSFWIICMHISLPFFFGECSSTTVVVLGAIFGITNTFRPFSDDIFRYSKNLMFFHVLAYTYVSHLFLSQY